MAAIEHNLVTRTAIKCVANRSGDLKSDKWRKQGFVTQTQGDIILCQTLPLYTLMKARQARFLYLDVSSKSVSFYGRCDANHPSFCHLKSICCVYSGFSDPCGLGLDCKPPRLVHLQDLPQQRHLVTKKPTFC